MEPIYNTRVTTLPDQGGEGTSRLLRHLDPAARPPDALDASEIPSVEKVTACLDDLEVLVARETRANHRLRKEAAARGERRGSRRSARCVHRSHIILCPCARSISAFD